MLEATKNLIRHRGRSFFREFACNKVVGVQDSILVKVNFSSFLFRGFFPLFRNTYIKERILMAASVIYFSKLFLVNKQENQ